MFFGVVNLLQDLQYVPQNTRCVRKVTDLRSYLHVGAILRSTPSVSIPKNGAYRTRGINLWYLSKNSRTLKLC